MSRTPGLHTWPSWSAKELLLLSLRVACTCTRTILIWAQAQMAEQWTIAKLCLAVRDDSKLYLKAALDFYDQVMGQMAVIRVDWCDFVVFTADDILC